GLGLYGLESGKSRARGIVLVSSVQMNHAVPASELIQSIVAPSCSAAKTRSPPSLAASDVVVAEPPFLLLPQAAATSDSTTNAAANSLTFLGFCMFFTSRTCRDLLVPLPESHPRQLF